VLITNLKQIILPE